MAGANSQLCRISFVPINGTDPEQYLAVDNDTNVVRLSTMQHRRRTVCELWSMVMNPNARRNQGEAEVIFYHVFHPAEPLTTVGDDRLELQHPGQDCVDFSWWTIHPVGHNIDNRQQLPLSFDGHFDDCRYEIQWRRSPLGLRAVQTNVPNSMTVRVEPFLLYGEQNDDRHWKIVLDRPVLPDIARERWFLVDVGGPSSYDGITASTRQGVSYNDNPGTDTTGPGRYNNQEDRRNRRHRRGCGLEEGADDPKKNLAGCTSYKGLLLVTSRTGIPNGNTEKMTKQLVKVSDFTKADEDLSLVISQTSGPIGNTEKSANQPVKVSVFAKGKVAPEAPLVTSSSLPVTV